MQTHLSEQTDEIAWVARLYPDARDYLDTYEAAGLTGPGAMFGHAIHLSRKVGGSLVVGDVAPPHHGPASLYTDRRHVAQAVHRGFRRTR